MLYDILIIGAAPAGLSAALYAARAGNSVLVLDKSEPGGQAASTSSIENYPGTRMDIKGPELVDLMVDQAKAFGAVFQKKAVTGLELKGDIKLVKAGEEVFEAKKVIIATGASPRKLNVSGEREFTGKGVSYCATCDGPFFEGLDIFVIGGGNSAIDEALYLTRFAKTVTVVHRKDTLKADKVTQDLAFKNDKIKFIWNTEVTEIKGKGVVNSVTLKNNQTGETTELNASGDMPAFGVFVFVGHIPQTEMFKDLLELEGGYIVTDEDMRTSIPGVFAAGDVRKKTLRQVVTAAADGAIAAFVASKELEH